MTEPTFVRVSAVDCHYKPAPWGFAIDRAAEIDTHWREQVARKPDMFNGRVLVLSDGGLATSEAGGPVFRGTFQEIEFKAFLAWREFGFPRTDVRNCFAMAAIETIDGAFVLGEMGPHTATAGQVYFPSGTPDRSDIHEGWVDLESSARRELREETGLGETDVAFLPGFDLVMDPIRVCCMKPIHAPVTAETLVGRIHAWLARETRPELARMHIIRGPANIGPRIPSFVAAYLRRAFAAR